MELMQSLVNMSIRILEGHGISPRAGMLMLGLEMGWIRLCLVAGLLGGLLDSRLVERMCKANTSQRYFWLICLRQLPANPSVV